MAATDDVQIARVELILQGDNLLTTDVSFPFDLDFAVPRSLPDGTPITLTIRAIDTGGNVADQIFNLMYQAVAPRVTSSDPEPNEVTNERLSRIMLTFDEPIDGSMLLPGDIEFVEDGADDTFGTGDDVETPIILQLFAAGSTQLTLFTGGVFGPGTHRLTVPAAKILDLGGVMLDGELAGAFPSGDGTPGGDFVFTFEVEPPADFSVDSFPMRRFPTDSSPITTRAVGRVVLADLNGDGRQDVLRTLADMRNGVNDAAGFTVSLALVEGGYLDPLPFGIDNGPAGDLDRKPVQLATGDVNNDGDLDMVTLNHDDFNALDANNRSFRSPFDFSVFLGNGDGTFEPERTLSGAGRMLAFSQEIFLGDVNGDSRDDLIQLVPDFRNDTDDVDGEVLIFISNGNGTFAAPTSIAVPVAGPNAGSQRTQLDTADFNNDNRLDLLVVGFFGAHPALVLLGNGDGTFTTVTNTVFVDDSQRLLIGELTDDNFPDVIYGRDVYRGIGDGTFTQVANDGIPNTIFQFESSTDLLADFTGDGEFDLAVGATIGGVSGLQVLAGVGNGTFTVGQGVAVGIGSFSGAAADANNDGRLDILLGDAGSLFDADPAGVSIIFANTDGTLHAPIVDADLQPSSGFQFTADLNGDGRDDLIATWR